jgi:hypothetical protein
MQVFDDLVPGQRVARHGPYVAKVDDDHSNTYEKEPSMHPLPNTVRLRVRASGAGHTAPGPVAAVRPFGIAQPVDGALPGGPRRTVRTRARQTDRQHSGLRIGVARAFLRLGGLQRRRVDFPQAVRFGFVRDLGGGPGRPRAGLAGQGRRLRVRGPGLRFGRSRA